MPVVDLRFVVHDKADIDLATKSLVAFNKVSLSRQKNYDAEAAAAKRGMTATTKLLSLDRKLTTQRKIEKQMVEDGLMSKKEQIALSERYDRILEQETRTLQDYIDTDRVLQREQKDAAKAEEALGKQRTKTKNETEKLRRTYDSTYAATKRYKQGLKDIDRAFEGMEDGPERASRAIKALKSDYQAFIAASKSGGLVDAGNQFARYGDQAYRAQQRTKRFASVGLQQAGYQVNDFIVQIASGQNALVAFGQQGSQLAGIFGTKGAVVGAIIAAVAAVGNLVYQAYMAQEGIKTLEDALTDLEAALSMVSEAEQVIENIGSGDYFGHMANEADLLAESLRALGLTMGLVELKAGMKAVTDIDMGLMDEFIAGTVKQAKELTLALIPFQYLFIKKKTLEEEMLDSQAAGMAGDLFGPDSGKVGFTEAFLQDLEKLQQEPAINAQKIADRVSGFVNQARIWGFDDATEDGRKLFDQLIKLGEGAAKIAEVQADSIRLEQARRAVVLESANEFEALYTQMDKEEKARLKAAQFEFSQQEKLDKLKADAWKKISKRNEDNKRAIASGGEVVLQYQEKEAKGLALISKKSDDIADQQRRENFIAVKAAEAKVRAVYANLVMNDKLTAAMEAQIIAARAAAKAAVDHKFSAAAAAETTRQNAIDARELATQLERAARSYETFLNRTLNLKDTEEGIRKQIEVLQKGGSTQDAAAEGRYTTEMKKIKREAAALREQQNALGPDRTKTDAQITKDQLDQELKQIAVLRATKDLNAELEKRKGKGGKTPKSAKAILDKEERSMSLKLDQRRALIGLTDQEILLENTKYALMSKVQEQMATMSESDKAATIAKIDGIAQEMAAREEQIKLMEEVEAQNRHIADSIAGSMGDAFMSIVDGTKSVKDAFKSMARAIIKELYEVLVVQQLVGSAKAGSRSGIAGGIMDFFGSANGNAMYGGNVIPFASGGVVGSPTTFPMSAGRTGLMGEAGPEAIMPLKRGANGKLGVQAEGGAGDVVIHQNFNFAANGDESVKKLIAQAAPQIANMTKSSIISDRRRGGQMKATFG